MSGTEPPRRSRRQFLRLGGTTVSAALLAACGAVPEGAPAPATFDSQPTTAPGRLDILPTVSPSPVATARRVDRPLGDRRQLERLALPGTLWETPVYINRSGEPGPNVMVLGGVHGNEPGGWAATDQIAHWMPDRGRLIVVPRANVLAIEAGQRTLPELGDLNRFYPGVPPESANAFPMQRMAYSIIELAREFEVSLLLDLHESWGFFNERTQDGTAFLGQTVTNSVGGEVSAQMETIAESVNELITERERLVVRYRSRFSHVPSNSNFDPSWPTGGTSSLGIGRFVPGLVEMGQQNQSEARRAELHQLFVRTALQREGLATA